MQSSPAQAPPPFLELAANPIRWQLLSALSRSDRAVRELTALTGERQSLVSYHLGRLRDAQLVAMRRSAADGRDTYYTANLAKCSELLSAAGAALHPGLAPHEYSDVTDGPRFVRPCSVLFLCTGNSARSQMAEALFTRRTAPAGRAFSAGSHPKPLRPEAIGVMAARGLDISGNRSKQLAEFAGTDFDYVVTLCDRVREVCPEFPGRPITIHWSMADPAAEDDPAAFERTAAELETRIAFLIDLIEAQQNNPQED